MLEWIIAGLMVVIGGSIFMGFQLITEGKKYGGAFIFAGVFMIITAIMFSKQTNKMNDDEMIELGIKEEYVTEEAEKDIRFTAEIRLFIDNLEIEKKQKEIEELQSKIERSKEE